jgi:hypothetical protein
MALKITTQIGTDKGITSEAYVRISNYSLSKHGSANFQIEIYQSEADITVIGNTMPTMGTGQARNQQIGETLFISLTKQVEETVTKTQMVNVPVTTQEERLGPLDADGNPTTVMIDVVNYTMEEQEVTETITKTVTDLSSAEGIDIFAFGYSHLKAKLVSLFGAENVVDC